MIRSFARLSPLLFTALFCQGVLAADEEWRFQYKPLSGAYEVYSGELSDPRPAGKSGASLAIRIDKDAARQIFEQMERDIPNLCPSEPGERMRQKNDLTCYRSRSGKHTCYVGFDLKSGRSQAGHIC